MKAFLIAIGIIASLLSGLWMGANLGDSDSQDPGKIQLELITSRKKVRELEETRDSLQSELTSIAGNAEKLDKNAAELKRKHAELQNTYALLLRERSALDSDLVQAQTEIHILLDQSNRYQREIEYLSKQVSQLQSETPGSPDAREESFSKIASHSITTTHTREKNAQIEVLLLSVASNKAVVGIDLGIENGVAAGDLFEAKYAGERIADIRITEVRDNFSIARTLNPTNDLSNLVKGSKLHLIPRK